MKLKRRLDGGQHPAAQIQMSTNLQDIKAQQISSGHNKHRNNNI